MPRFLTLSLCLLGLALPTSSAAATPTKVAVEVYDFGYNAPSVTIKKGGTVTWQWLHTAIRHDVRGSGFASGLRSSGSWSFTFKKTGTFRYVCSLHSVMAGKVIVKS